MLLRILLLLSLAFATRTFAVDVSILDFQRKQSALKKVNRDEADFFTGRVRKVAAQTDRSWRVMSRENIQKILEENGKDYKACLASAEGKCEVSIGELLQADYHVVGDLSVVGGVIVVSMRLYDVKTSTLKGSEDATGATVNALMGSVDVAAKRLFRSVTGLASSDVVTEPGAHAEVVSTPPAAGEAKRVVRFSSVPDDAAVTVDGMFLCQTPNGKALVEGEHLIEMGKDGYRSRREKVRVATNGQEVSWTLTPMRTRLSLEAVDDRTGGDLVADVYVDGAKVGQTPYDGLVAVFAKTIEVVPAGFDREVVSVTLEEGRTASATAHFRSVEKPKAAGTPTTSAGMVSIPAGCFQMGSENGYDDEKPVHRVCLDAFRMDVTEVTQGAYRSVVGRNPSTFGSCGDDCPVEEVDWTEARNYCERVGKRLPSEAEWEYAARAGTTTKWYWGDDESRAGEYAWYHGNSGSQTHPVGRKRPNGWGLYDMSGNVWEWVGDWDGAYPSSGQRNPTGPASGSSRVNRGGSWDNSPVRLPSAHRRLDNAPGDHSDRLGFRCAGS